jgi:hypothetical protein
MASKTSSAKPRLRAASAARSHGAASSLLRLSHTGATPRLPSSGALASWLRRAAVPLSDSFVSR